ncbi:MAG: ankyrin repeat domain-containing protein [Gammaproteobacteria bacterium]|nr:ankyrin repeat domain-containing protein [Gammaproteobacteria bacterium]
MDFSYNTYYVAKDMCEGQLTPSRIYRFSLDRETQLPILESIEYPMQSHDWQRVESLPSPLVLTSLDNKPIVLVQTGLAQYPFACMPTRLSSDRKILPIPRMVTVPKKMPNTLSIGLFTDQNPELLRQSSAAVATWDAPSATDYQLTSEEIVHIKETLTPQNTSDLAQKSSENLIPAVDCDTAQNNIFQFSKLNKKPMSFPSIPVMQPLTVGVYQEDGEWNLIVHTVRAEFTISLKALCTEEQDFIKYQDIKKWLEKQLNGRLIMPLNVQSQLTLWALSIINSKFFHIIPFITQEWPIEGEMPKSQQLLVLEKILKREQITESEMSDNTLRASLNESIEAYTRMLEPKSAAKLFNNKNLFPQKSVAFCVELLELFIVGAYKALNAGIPPSLEMLPNFDSELNNPVKDFLDNMQNILSEQDMETYSFVVQFITDPNFPAIMPTFTDQQLQQQLQAINRMIYSPGQSVDLITMINRGVCAALGRSVELQLHGYLITFTAALTQINRSIESYLDQIFVDSTTPESSANQLIVSRISPKFLAWTLDGLLRVGNIQAATHIIQQHPIVISHFIEAPEEYWKTCMNVCLSSNNKQSIEFIIKNGGKYLTNEMLFKLLKSGNHTIITAIIDNADSIRFVDMTLEQILKKLNELGTVTDFQVYKLCKAYEKQLVNSDNFADKFALSLLQLRSKIPPVKNILTPIHMDELSWPDFFLAVKMSCIESEREKMAPFTWNMFFNSDEKAQWFNTFLLNSILAYPRGIPEDQEHDFITQKDALIREIIQSENYNYALHDRVYQIDNEEKKYKKYNVIDYGPQIGNETTQYLMKKYGECMSDIQFFTLFMKCGYEPNTALPSDISMRLRRQFFEQKNILSGCSHRDGSYSEVEMFHVFAPYIPQIFDSFSEEDFELMDKVGNATWSTIVALMLYGNRRDLICKKILDNHPENIPRLIANCPASHPVSRSITLYIYDSVEENAQFSSTKLKVALSNINMSHKDMLSDWIRGWSPEHISVKMMLWFADGQDLQADPNVKEKLKIFYEKWKRHGIKNLSELITIYSQWNTFSQLLPTELEKEMLWISVTHTRFNSYLKNSSSEMIKLNELPHLLELFTINSQESKDKFLKNADILKGIYHSMLSLSRAEWESFITKYPIIFKEVILSLPTSYEGPHQEWRDFFRAQYQSEFPQECLAMEYAPFYIMNNGVAEISFSAIIDFVESNSTHTLRTHQLFQKMLEKPEVRGWLIKHAWRNQGKFFQKLYEISNYSNAGLNYDHLNDLNEFYNKTHSNDQDALPIYGILPLANRNTFSQEEKYKQLISLQENIDFETLWTEGFIPASIAIFLAICNHNSIVFQEAMSAVNRTPLPSYKMIYLALQKEPTDLNAFDAMLNELIERNKLKKDDVLACVLLAIADGCNANALDRLIKNHNINVYYDYRKTDLAVLRKYHGVTSVYNLSIIYNRLDILENILSGPWTYSTIDDNVNEIIMHLGSSAALEMALKKHQTELKPENFEGFFDYVSTNYENHFRTINKTPREKINEYIDLLLAYGANIDHALPILKIAVQKKDTDMINLLLDKDINPNLTDEHGKNAYDYAKEVGLDLENIVQKEQILPSRAPIIPSIMHHPESNRSTNQNKPK